MVLALPPRHRLARRKTIEFDLADDPWTAPSYNGLVARTCRAAGSNPELPSWRATHSRSAR